jgi:hypothetical protein
LAAIPAHGQPSCAIVDDPLRLLVGTWTFDMDGFAPPRTPYASAGQFIANILTVNGVKTAALTITQSTSTGVRLEVVTGKYQILDDCSGGSLLFNSASGPTQFDFWFDEFYGEIRFVCTNSGFVIVGTAERIVAPDAAPDNAALAASVKPGQRRPPRFHYPDARQPDNPALRPSITTDRRQ